MPSKSSIQGDHNVHLNESHGNVINNTTIINKKSSRSSRYNKVPIDTASDTMVLVGRFLAERLKNKFLPAMWSVLLLGIIGCYYFIYVFSKSYGVYIGIALALLAAMAVWLLSLSKTRCCPKCNANFAGREYKSQDYLAKRRFKDKIVHYYRKHVKCLDCSHRWAFEYDVEENKND